MNRIRLLSIAVIVVAISAGVAVSILRQRTAGVSDTITHSAPELGPHAHALLPNLRDAVVVVADRPHEPFEVIAEDRAQRLTRLRSFTVSTNSDGLRGEEVRQPKPELRILCVGDSVTFGWGLAQTQTYPAQLERILAAQGRDVEVLNAGVPAMKPSSVAKWVSLHAAALQPDLVLFARRPDWGSPDPWGSYQRAVQSIAQDIAPAKLGVLLPPVSTFDPRGVAAMADEQQRISQLIGSVPMLDLTPAFRAALPLPGVILESSGQTQRMLSQPGREVLIEATAPTGGPGTPALAPEIIAAFESDSDLAEPLFFDGGHPDAEGAVLFSETVAQWLQEQGLL